MKTLFINISDISGQGLFAAEPYKKGSIAIYELPIVTEKLWNSIKGKETELFLIFNNIYDIRNSELKYLNHSAKPNVDYVDNRNGVKIIAKRDIEKNEELTINYGWTKKEWNTR